MARGCLRAVALLVPLLALFHAERVLAASDMPGVAASSADADGYVELALCEFADISIADGSGTCDFATLGPGASPSAAEKAEDSAPLADPSVRAAPMCDNAAASIAATPEVPEIDTGKIEPVPCDVQRLLDRLRSDERAGAVNLVAGSGRGQPEPQPIGESGERFDAACTSTPRWPLTTEPSSILRAAPRGLEWQPGHSARVERPPSGA